MDCSQFLHTAVMCQEYFKQTFVLSNGHVWDFVQV